MALPAFLPTAPSKQLEEGEGFELATFRLRVRRLIPYTNCRPPAAGYCLLAAGMPENADSADGENQKDLQTDA